MRRGTDVMIPGSSTASEDQNCALALVPREHGRQDDGKDPVVAKNDCNGRKLSPYLSLSLGRGGYGVGGGPLLVVYVTAQIPIH